MQTTEDVEYDFFACLNAFRNFNHYLVFNLIGLAKDQI